MIKFGGAEITNLNTYEELKAFCDEKVKEINDEKFIKRYRKEIKVAERLYKVGRNLYKELTERTEEIDNRYTIPFLLGLTKDFDLNKPTEYIQIKIGDSGGIDIDSDFQGLGREKIFAYLQEKYGYENVIHVGTSSTLGPASAAKDILRVYEVDFGMSNKFTAALEKTETWEENLKRIKNSAPDLYKFYEKNKEILDLVPNFMGKVRNTGSHAGGVVVTDKPVYNYIPVDRAGSDIVSAFPESGQDAILDEIGLVKLDILGISILDVISGTIEMIDEELYEIEEDGIIKIVGASYLVSKGIEI